MARSATGRKVGRNEPCPCGSGLKYKLCCEGKLGVVSRFGWYVIALVILVSAAVVLFSVTRTDVQGPRQVWSPEHGHYHSVP